MPLEDVITGALLFWAVSIAAADWRWRKVPNLLLLALLLPTIAALALQGSGLMAAPWQSSLAGALIATALTLPGYLVKRLGAGDVKLAAVVGLVLGWPAIGWMLLCAALLLGLMALMALMAVVMLGFANARSVRLPAAVALAGGFAAVVVNIKTGWL